MYLENLTVGSRCASPVWRVTEADVRAADTIGSTCGVDLTSPPGHVGGAHLELLTEQAFWQLALVPRDAATVVAKEWTLVGAVPVGSELRVEATVVRVHCREGADSGTAIVCLVVRGTHSVEPVLAGSLTVALASDGSRRDTTRDVATVPWARALSERLSLDPSFRSALASWDGTIGLRAGVQEVHLRIYRGAVIDVTPRAPLGPTFVLGASDHTWAEVLSDPHLNFGARLMTGDFQVSGNPYEYLRVTKALDLVVRTACEMANGAPTA